MVGPRGNKKAGIAGLFCGQGSGSVDHPEVVRNGFRAHVAHMAGAGTENVHHHCRSLCLPGRLTFAGKDHSSPVRTHLAVVLAEDLFIELVAGGVLRRKVDRRDRLTLRFTKTTGEDVFDLFLGQQSVVRL